MTLAGIGVLINGVAAWLFASGRKGDINVRVAYLHMAADAAVSAGVIVAGFVISQTGWLWVDPGVSLVIVVVIFAATWRLLRDSVNMSMDAVPPAIDPTAVETDLSRLPGVSRVHDLHIWHMSTTEVALTCHLVVPAGHPPGDSLRSTGALLEKRHGIHHFTIQLETLDDEDCGQAPTGAV